MTRYTGLLLYDNSTQFANVSNVTLQIPVPESYCTSAAHIPVHKLHSFGAKFLSHGNGFQQDGGIELSESGKSEVALAGQQSASGAWLNLAVVCRLLRRNVPVVPEKWSEETVATALALWDLSKDGDARFERIIEKGREWLVQQLGTQEAAAIIAWAKSAPQ
jgi:hypothetical protein